MGAGLGATQHGLSAVAPHCSTEANISELGCVPGPTAAGIEILNGSPVTVVQNVVADNVGGCAGGVAWGVSDDDVLGPRAGAYLINNTIAQTMGQSLQAYS